MGTQTRMQPAAPSSLLCAAWFLGTVGLILAGGGCILPRARRIRDAPPTPRLKPAERSATVWPTVVVRNVPGPFTPPWPPRPGASLELWQIDLLDLDRPEVTPWLEAWQPRGDRLARPVPIEVESETPWRLRLPRPGAYVLRSRSGSEVSVALVLASEIHAMLTLFDDDCEVLCAEAQTGKPVSGAYVRVLYRSERLGRERLLAVSGSTDADGRWRSSMLRDRFAPSLAATAVASHGGHYAVATQRRVLDHSEAAWRLSVTARSHVFRPGQTAELVGMVQARPGHRFAPAAGAPVKLLLLDPGEVVAGSLRTATDEVGSFTAAFELAKDAPPGAYTVVIGMEDAPRFEPRRFDAFSVALPSPSRFRVKLGLSRSVVAPGDPLELQVEAARPDGGPIAGARVRVLTWGYPVAMAGGPAWASGTAPCDPRQIVAIPIRLPPVTQTDSQGRATVRWEPTHAELPSEDLLCGVQVEVLAPGLGTVERSAEFVLLREAPAVTVEAKESFLRPGEPLALSFRSALPPALQEATQAVCTVEHEESDGEAKTREVARASVAWLLSQRLNITTTSPGRYKFAVEAAGRSDAVSVWVADDGKDVYWGGAEAPAFYPEAPWVRRGGRVRAVVAAPGRTAPVAMTLRGGPGATWRTLSLRTGALGLALGAGPDDRDPLDITLVQIAEERGWAGRASLGVEPGGRVLDIQPRLLWVRQGEWSGRGFGVATRDRLGQPVRSVVRLELVRPTFQGSPPAGILRRTTHWHPGKLTSEGGEIEVGFHDSLLATASALLIDAHAPDGRSGLFLMPLCQAAYAPGLKAGEPMSPRARLAALAGHGLDSPLAQWLASRLLGRHPELAHELPSLLQAAKSDEEASAIVAIAAEHQDVAPAVIASAVQRSGPVAQAALSVGARFLPGLRAVFEDALAADPHPLVRAAAARGLGRAMPASLQAVLGALSSDKDPIVRSASAAALAEAGPGAIPYLADAARRDSSTAVRLAAVGALQRLGSVAAAEALLDLASGANEEVAVAALGALGAIGYHGTDERLLRVLDAGAPDARTAAARLLARQEDPHVAQALVGAVRRAPSGPLLRALAPMRGRAVQAAMARGLSHEDPEVQLAAAEWLASVEDERAPAALRKFLAPDAAATFTDRAAATLAALRDTSAVPVLVALLDTGRLSASTRRALVEMAGSLGLQEAGPALVKILWRGLAEPALLRQPEERALWAAALQAAGAVGPVWSPLIENAVGPLPTNSPYVPALMALRAQGLPGFFAELWRSPLPDDLRRQSVLPYARMRGAAAAPQLAELLESPVLQGPAMQALAEAGAVETLSAALRGGTPEARAAAAEALGATGEPRAVPVLQPLLRDGDPFVRCEAAWALAALTRQAVLYVDHLGETREATP
ncbi:MAG TPA: HEAT repeat domain-containing protein [Planctomycetota bacterium]|nr:HEAT repeat domain-containing protein [Planctomycetota bacterium]HRR80131.1 HEAT repeat domain-containing protein [Planctomycetota bacterium]